MRKPFIAGNWKMNLERASAADLVGALRGACDGERVDVAVCPPFVYLPEVARALEGSAVRVGAQNLCAEAAGAFTGEVSAAMLRDVGADLVIVGHSERRHLFGEEDALVNRKVQAALNGQLDVILCVGETLQERQAERTETVVLGQLDAGLRDVAAADLARTTIAYEPVWAIGTGHTATPRQAGEVHALLRGRLGELYGAAAAAAVRIQYGGSVKPDNVDELMAVEDIDGALVGGASLQAESFLRIAHFRS